MDASILRALFQLPPEHAIRYLEAKGYRLTWSWWEMQRDAHARAFTVAKLAKLDVLADIRTAVETALKEGRTEAWFRKELEGTLRKKGWWGPQVDVDPVTGEAQLYQAGSKRRLQTIYRTNLQTAYMAGRQKQFDAEAARAPFVQYLAVRDSRTRPAHAALHGKVFRLDDPAWSVIGPSNGWNCRCRARNLSQRELDARGLKPETDARIETREPPGKRPVDPRTGQTPDDWTQRGVSIPDPLKPGARRYLWADVGWGYNPGRASAGLAQLGQRLLRKSATADPKLAATAVASALADPTLLAALTDEFGDWSRRWLAELQAAEAAQAAGERYALKTTGELRHVGSIPPRVLALLEQRGILPQSSVISVRDEDVIHAHRTAKVGELSRDWYAELPRHLTQPKAILLDESHAKKALLYVYDLPGSAGKLVVTIDYEVTARDASGRRVNLKVNTVQTGRVVQAANLKGYEVLAGSLEGLP